MSKSIKVNFINGNKKSVCNNDAYSVVETINGEEQSVLDIIPVVEIPGKNSNDLYVIRFIFHPSKFPFHHWQFTQTMIKSNYTLGKGAG